MEQPQPKQMKVYEVYLTLCVEKRIWLDCHTCLEGGNNKASRWRRRAEQTLLLLRTREKYLPLVTSQRAGFQTCVFLHTRLLEVEQAKEAKGGLLFADRLLRHS